MRDISLLINEIERAPDHATLVNIVHGAVQEAYRAGLEKATEIALRTGSRLGIDAPMDAHCLEDLPTRGGLDKTAH